MNRQLAMTTLKRICIPRGKMVASLVIIAGMLTACGKKSRNGSWLDERYNPYAINNLSELGAQLPQNSSSDSIPSSSETWQLPTNNPPAGSPTSQELTIGAAQDFGNLFHCYQNILDLGKGYFRQGYTSDAIFKGAGEQIVSCYQQAINQRVQALQAQEAYRQYLYQQQYQEKMRQFLAYMAAINSQPIYETVRPPGLR